VPVWESGDRLSILPAFTLRTSGHQSARRLADDQSLFRSETGAGLNVTVLHRPRTDWKVAWRTGAQATWLRETTDERAWRGTYDHRDVFIGGDLEKSFDGESPTFLRVGVESVLTRFPRFLNPGSPRGRRPMDTLSLGGFVRGERFSARAQWTGEARVTRVRFLDQRRNAPDGTVRGGDRGDWRFEARGRARRQWSAARPWSLSAGLGALWQTSDQLEIADLDTPQQRVIRRYHDFVEPATDLGVSWEVSPRWTLAGTLETRIRLYRERETRNAEGDYTGRRLRATDVSATVSARRALGDHLALFTDAGWSRTVDNTRYALGRQRFTARHVQLGVSVDF
jgi:hypothetical protein